MSLPNNEDVKRFLAGLGADKEQVVASLEMLGARDAPGTGRVLPLVRNCVIAMALRKEFPELNDDHDWAVGSLCVRFSEPDEESAYNRWVYLPEVIRAVMSTVDDERMRIGDGDGDGQLMPTYPKLMAPREGS